MIRTTQTIVPKMFLKGRRHLSNDDKGIYNHKTNDYDDAMMNIMAGVVYGGGMIGASFGCYRGYLLHRHNSYTNCAFHTTFYGFSVGIGGMLGGLCLLAISPVIVPIVCISIPIAGGAVMVKYFDSDAKSS